MQCFTAIDGLNPKIDDWDPFTRVPFRLLHRLKNKCAFTSTSASMGEGYALLIEEGRHPFGSQFMTSVFCSTATVIQALYNQNLVELDGLRLLFKAIYWDYALWAIYCFVSRRFRLESSLLTTVARILNFLFCSFDKGTKLKRDGLIIVLSILNSGILRPIILQLLANYSIKIDWKDVRSLFW